MAKRRKRLNKLTSIKAIICLFKGEAAEEEGGGEGGAELIFPKEEGEMPEHSYVILFCSILYNGAYPDHIFEVDMLLDQLTRQFPMRVPAAPAAIEGPR